MFREAVRIPLMQTDPNIAKLPCTCGHDQVALLDLGSVGEYPRALVEATARLPRRARDDDAALREAVFEISTRIRTIPGHDAHSLESCASPRAAPAPRPYDFAGSGLLVRPATSACRGFGKGLRSPPPETIFLHRKLIGTFLICAKLHRGSTCTRRSRSTSRPAPAAHVRAAGEDLEQHQSRDGTAVAERHVLLRVPFVALGAR